MRKMVLGDLLHLEDAWASGSWNTWPNAVPGDPLYSYTPAWDKWHMWMSNETEGGTWHWYLKHLAQDFGLGS